MTLCDNLEIFMNVWFNYDLWKILYNSMIMEIIIFSYWKCIFEYFIYCMLNYKIMFWIMDFGNLPNLLSSCNSPLFYSNFSEPKITPTDKHLPSSSEPTSWLSRLSLRSWYIYILIFYILVVWIIISGCCASVVLITIYCFCCVVWVI